MSAWLYNDEPVTSTDQMPPKTIGFIYLITQLSTGKKYIGRKMITKAGRKTTNGKTKKIRVENDWQTYWSSSPVVQELVKEIGEQDFKREILVYTTSKGSSSYLEEMALHMVGALESDDFLNNNIRARIFRNWVKPDEAKQLRQQILKFDLQPKVDV